MRDLTGHAPHTFPIRFNPVVPARSMIDGIALAFDFGTRRIGVAIGNSLTREARALTAVDASNGDVRWSALGALIDEWQPAQLVVGIPRHPDGAAHDMTERCERFARQLEGRYRLPVARVDERYSSAVAERADDVDAAAAAIILQQWFDGDA